MQISSRIERNRQAGFTLMEVVLALAIVGMLAVLGLPYVKTPTSVSALRSKASEIVAMLRLERNNALRFRTVTTVLVDADRSRVSGRSGDITVPPSMELRLLSTRQRRVQFFADGRASNMQLSLTSAGKALTISVNPVTAEVAMWGTSQ
jgi:prepilin-type N-terminal cleavage/methylation domain-containing protein